MTKLTALLLSTVALFALASPAGAAPLANAVALTRADLPSNVSIVAQDTKYYPPRSMNADTVPFGLSPQQLRAANFQGLYAQAIYRRGESTPYSWQYLAFGSSSGAERIYQRWTRVFKYPFTKNGGSATICEGLYYKVIAVSPPQAALLCRSGNFVVLGHYGDKGTLTRLMSTVVGRIKHTR